MLRQGQALSGSSEVDDSFMSLDDRSNQGGANWATKIKSTLNAVRPARDGAISSQSQAQSPVLDPVQEDSFVDMGDSMTDKEKAVARRKAQKLEYVSHGSTFMIRQVY